MRARFQFAGDDRDTPEGSDESGQADEQGAQELEHVIMGEKPAAGVRAGEQDRHPGERQRRDDGRDPELAPRQPTHDGTTVRAVR